MNESKYREECKDCEYCIKTPIDYNPFPWLDGQCYRIECSKEMCIYDEE